MNYDTRFPKRFNRLAYLIIYLFPIGVMAILTVKVLLPTLKDPQSKMYDSQLGDPALHRLASKPIVVKVATVKPKNYNEGLIAAGQSVATKNVQLTPLLNLKGIVEHVYVKEGDRVHKGQRLLKIEQDDYKDLVKQAQNNLATAEAQLASLKASKVAVLEKLKADLANAQNRLSNARDWVAKYDGSTKKGTVDDVEHLKLRLEVARKQLDLSSKLLKEGGISLNQFYQAQENYYLHKQLLADAQNVLPSTINQGFANKDLLAQTKGMVLTSQIALEKAKETLDKDLKVAQLNVDQQKVALEMADKNLKRTVIYASTDGLVSGLNINAGELVDPVSSVPLINITQNVVFKAYVDQARLNFVKIGDRATVRLVSYPGQTFSGRVIQINPTVGIVSNVVGLRGNVNSTTATQQSNSPTQGTQFTYPVWIAVDDLEMSPGLEGYAEVRQQAQANLVIPESSLTHLSSGEGIVMVVEGDKVVPRKVKVGRKVDNQRPVIAGLKEGEKVILYPNGLIPGDRVATESESS